MVLWRWLFTERCFNGNGVRGGDGGYPSGTGGDYLEGGVDGPLQCRVKSLVMWCKQEMEEQGTRSQSDIYMYTECKIESIQ